MICPQCGANTTAVKGRCTACGLSVTSARPVAATGQAAATSVLTPPPASFGALPQDPDATPPPDRRSVDPDVTRLPEVRSIPGSEDESTIGTGRPGLDTVFPTGADDATHLLTGAARMSSGTGPLAAGQRFGPRYRIIRLLGMGGMGAVYQAWDAELDVVVAVKVIRPEATSDPDETRAIERRFKQELLLARQVTHKNVVRIHDLGEIDGIKYITMSYLEGADLATVLKGAGKLPVPEALKIMRQVASGLQAAHEAGVVHRDLKPANIMVEGDHAIIMDFGIARSASGAGPALPAGTLPPGVWQQGRNAPQATVVGTVVGTVAYMAPEQARGEAVDQRADLYALGLIVSDMLLGPRPGREHTLEELQRRMKEAPPALRSVDPQIPEALERIVSRCVEPNAAARFQTSAELVADLDRLDEHGKLLPLVRRLTPRLVAATAVLILGMAAGTYFIGQWTAPVPVEPEPMPVLIADFENRTGEPLFDGVLEQALSVGIEGASFIHAYPRVDARRLVQQIAQSDRLDVEGARIVAQREGVKMLLAGSIAKDGSRYRVTVSGIDPIPGTTLSTVAATAATPEDVLKAVGELASELRTALGDTTPESARLSERETFTAGSLQAASAYSQGQELLNTSKYLESISYFQRATELDPGFARAYASWAVAAFSTGRRDEAAMLYKRAFALADRMTEREKYRTYGTYYLTVMPAYDQAIENYTKLLQLYPSDRVGHGNLAVAYFYVLNFAKAMEEGRRAFQLYPTTKLRNNLALYAMYASDFATANQEAEQVVKADPQYTRAYVPIAIAALDNDNPPAARTAYEKMSTTGADGASRAAMGLADLALYEGRYAEAAEVLRRAIIDDQKTKNVAALAAKYIALAEAYHGQGRSPEAVTAVRQALDTSRTENVQLAAGRLFLAVKREMDAKELADELGRKITGYGRTYARILDGEIAMRRGAVPEAVDAYREGQRLADLWLLHFNLGIAYVEAEQFPQALAEFEACLKRRGEATAIFQDDVPSFRYLIALNYWLGRAREGVGQIKPAAESYQRFLSRRQTAGDPLVRDAQTRLAALTS